MDGGVAAADQAAQRDTNWSEAHQLFLDHQGFAILSAVAGLLQLIQQCGLSHEQQYITSIFLSISLFAFSASIALSPKYTGIFVRMSFFFAILTCSSLLSHMVPSNLSMAPYISCVFPTLHFLSAIFRCSMEWLCWRTWNAASGAVSRACRALLRPTNVILPSTNRAASNGSDGSASSTIEGDQEEEQSGAHEILYASQ